MPNYIRQVLLSNSRKEEFYIQNPITKAIATKKGKVPPKSLTGERYKPLFDYKSKQYRLYDTKEEKFVIANPKAAGTAKKWTINSQDFYSGNVRFTRAKITQAIKEFMLPFVKDLFPLELGWPVKITMIVRDIPGQANWDIGNRAWIYLKCFEDLISSGCTGKKDKLKNDIQYMLPLIPNDNIKYISGREDKFVPITENETPCLIFILKQDEFNSTNQFYIQVNNGT